MQSWRVGKAPAPHPEPARMAHTPSQTPLPHPSLPQPLFGHPLCPIWFGLVSISPMKMQSGSPSLAALTLGGLWEQRGGLLAPRPWQRAALSLCQAAVAAGDAERPGLASVRVCVCGNLGALMSRVNAGSCCFGHGSTLILNLFLQPLFEVVYLSVCYSPITTASPSSRHWSACACRGMGSMGFGSESCLAMGLGAASIPSVSHCPAVLLVFLLAS